VRKVFTILDAYLMRIEIRVEYNHSISAPEVNTDLKVIRITIRIGEFKFKDVSVLTPPALVVKRYTKTSEFGLLNSSIPFCRSECFVWPSWCGRNIKMSGWPSESSWSYQSQIFEPLPVKEVFDDIKGNNELDWLSVNGGNMQLLDGNKPD
jgi:hypothetical protein